MVFVVYNYLWDFLRVVWNILCLVEHVNTGHMVLVAGYLQVQLFFSRSVGCSVTKKENQTFRVPWSKQNATTGAWFKTNVTSGGVAKQPRAEWEILHPKTEKDEEELSSEIEASWPAGFKSWYFSNCKIK